VPIAGGAACRLTPVVEDPLPLCAEHFESSGLRQYHEWCNAEPEDIAVDVHALRSKARARAEVDPDFEPFGLIERVVKRQAKARSIFESTSRKARVRAIRREDEAEAKGLIYFIGIEDLIKIGKTLDLQKRLSTFSYPKIKVLATERGYTVREAQLHGQFRELRSHGEWFHAEPPLLDYIAALPKGRKRY